MQNNGTEQEFGKDLGLMHELAVTGRRSGATRELWSRLAHNRHLLASVVRDLEPYPEPEGWEKARFTMEEGGQPPRNFFGPNEVREMLGCRFSPKDLYRLNKIPYPLGQLKKRARDYVLIAVPSINLIELDICTEGFVMSKHAPGNRRWPEFDYTDELFGRKKSRVRWLLFSRCPVQFRDTHAKRGLSYGQIAETALMIYLSHYQARPSCEHRITPEHAGDHIKCAVMTGEQEWGLRLFSNAIMPLRPRDRKDNEVLQFPDRYPLVWPFFDATLF